MLGLLKKVTAVAGAPNLIEPERPPVQSEKVEIVPTPQSSTAYKEYAALAKSVGFTIPHIDSDLRIERFKDYLRQKDWAIFPLASVVAYMNKKAAEESKEKSGWHWRALRAKDDIRDIRFGEEGWRHEDFRGKITSKPYSDFYNGPRKEMVRDSFSRPERREMGAFANPYDKLVPLHALKKVSAIELEFDGPVSFFVCDYAPAPHIQYPDPFLMAVINNTRLHEGQGRFVIDFWDEPGFGLNKQIEA